jgi:ABC-type transport system involved in multi-copper enzyme maturation permease subunit
MVLLPIVDRELRVAARKSGTYWMRTIAAAVVLVVFLALLANGSATMQRMGHQLLNAMGVLALGFSMLAGVFLTADCLSEEKRDGTLGLLFLTDLKGYDVVLGKLVANSLHSFFGLLAVFPILGLSLLLGGVTGGEFTRLLLVFGVTLFFSLNVGIFVSAISREARQAFVSTLMVIIVLGAIIPTVYWLATLVLKSVPFDFPFWTSAPVAYYRAFDSSYRLTSGPQKFWMSVGTIAFLGTACMTVASVLLPRTWHQEKSVRDKKRTENGAVPKFPRRPGIPVISGNPIFWLGVRDPKAGRMTMRVLFLLMLIALFFWMAAVASNRSKESFVACLISVYVAHLVVKFLSGALELLLVTPIGVKEILKGQQQALRQVFRPVMWGLTLMNVGLICTILGWSEHLQMNGRDQGIFFEMFAGGLLMLFLDSFALGWVGMWKGLNARKHHSAIIGSIAQILFLPWAIIYLMVSLQRGFRSAGQFATVLGIWFFVGAMVDVFSAAGAKRRLEQHLRSVAVGFKGKGR